MITCHCSGHYHVNFSDQCLLTPLSHTGLVWETHSISILSLVKKGTSCSKTIQQRKELQRNHPSAHHTQGAGKHNLSYSDSQTLMSLHVRGQTPGPLTSNSLPLKKKKVIILFTIVFVRILLNSI